MGVRHKSDCACILNQLQWSHVDLISEELLQTLQAGVLDAAHVPWLHLYHCRTNLWCTMFSNPVAWELSLGLLQCLSHV